MLSCFFNLKQMIMKDFVKVELSLDKCKSIICKDGEKYTDKEVKFL